MMAATPIDVAALVRDGYKQVSRKYGLVVKLPEGKTGKEALKEAARSQRPHDVDRWVEALGEEQAGNFYRRVYAGPHLTVELSETSLKKFRAAGGGVA
jgi:hypothetical protein